ncbi:dCTP deaminase [Halovenus salina]|uniref:dCTP deaminase n=1 Tax=Halovenus salina TaxID=1510225 RepID=A0ABD5W0J2_9EURY|nr:dCTP deaminase [Halovenus salina]
MDTDTEVLDGIVHEPTQTEGRGVDLTVAEVYEVTAPGHVDFGGGELEAADLSPHDSARRHADDDYEWWTLDAGQYLLEYNESIAVEEATITIQTRDELLARGASHPTLRLTSLDRVPLSVGGAGLKLKENARVSTVVDVDR